MTHMLSKPSDVLKNVNKICLYNSFRSIRGLAPIIDINIAFIQSTIKYHEVVLPHCGTIIDQVTISPSVCHTINLAIVDAYIPLFTGVNTSELFAMLQSLPEAVRLDPGRHLLRLHNFQRHHVGEGHPYFKRISL